MTSSPVSIFWFRRDLRIDDNHGLFQSLKAGLQVVPIFIFDKTILKKLERDDHRVSFIHQSLNELDKELKRFGSRLHVYHGDPLEIFKKIIGEHEIAKIFCNEDYEPYAVARDGEIAKLLQKNKIEFHSFKDHVVFAKSEIVKDDGSPYRMFTPYSRRWLEALKNQKITKYESAKLIVPLKIKFDESAQLPSLNEIGFRPSLIRASESKLSGSFIKRYGDERNFLNLHSTSKIGVHLRFGTISTRIAVNLAKKHSAAWLNELIWREFFQQIIFHFPHTVDQPFDKRFLQFPWRPLESRAAKKDFAAWSSGKTGYPIVDAGMRELNVTGFMHNRARMIVGSFLTKHLLIDWQHGERYFAEKLFDFDLASNVGNWQWVAGSGCDAAPYFRIFNPELQAKKFDLGGAYVKQWVPELLTKKYPAPTVDHEFARRRALMAYEKIRKSK